jgi:hypothetical protein
VGQAEERRCGARVQGQVDDPGIGEIQNKTNNNNDDCMGCGLSRRVRPAARVLAAGLTSYMICSV